jgi:hypothetical protein
LISRCRCGIFWLFILWITCWLIEWLSTLRLSFGRYLWRNLELDLLRVFLIIENLLDLPVICYVLNFIHYFFAQFNISYFLVFVINKSDEFVRIDSQSKIVNIKTTRIFLKLDLIVAFGEVAHNISETISIVKESGVN